MRIYLILSVLFLIVMPNAHASIKQIKTVFVILEENANWEDIKPVQMPYLFKTILPNAAFASQYYNPKGLHPSEPNYIWIEAGDNLGLMDDKPPSMDHSSVTKDHLVAYLNKAGISWKSYQEDISGNDCPLIKVSKYAPKHDPFVFFQDVTDNNNITSSYCKAHIRPMGELAVDLEHNTVARYNFIGSFVLRAKVLL